MWISLGLVVLVAFVVWQIASSRREQGFLKDAVLRLDARLDEQGKRFDSLSETTDKRLADGFEKTTATFTNVVQRLTIIDEAQKRITELSRNVVSLQEVLSDKHARGAFGEVQLSALVRNYLPESSFAFQHTLSNNTRVDCLLFLPAPTGNVPIDAKFPLESYSRMTSRDLGEAERRLAERQFKGDIRRHIQDIAGKYILPGETSDGAVMFIPAEAVFAEIHAHHADLVEEAQKAHVWMTSPTTLMAVLTTARAVLKDAATHRQVHLIQEQLGKLGEDFSRFEKRMEALANHIRQAHEDAGQVNTTARKISNRFRQIERVELAEGVPIEPPDEEALQ